MNPEFITKKSRAVRKTLSNMAEHHSGKLAAGKWLSIIGTILYLVVEHFGDADFHKDAAKITTQEWIRVMDLRDMVMEMKGRLDAMHADETNFVPAAEIARRINL